MVNHDWVFTILRCFHQCIVQIFNGTFMDVIVVFKAQATAEVFNMFWIDDGLVCDVHIHIVIVQSNKVCAQILYTVRYHIRNLS